MIASLSGKLIIKDLNSVVIECSGVGFRCTVSNNTYSTIGDINSNVFLNTYLAVREDALDLFGFSTIGELEMFKLITSVNGVGPKVAIAILSEFTADKLIIYIASGDAKALTKASGVGIKLAQRIVLELKDKIGKLGSDADAELIKSVGNANSNTNSKEAIEALVSLGYTQSEASFAVGKVNADLKTDEIIKAALRYLARGYNK